MCVWFQVLWVDERKTSLMFTLMVISWWHSGVLCQPPQPHYQITHVYCPSAQQTQVVYTDLSSSFPMGLSQIHIGDVATHTMITGINWASTMMSGNLQEYSAGRHIGLHMVWIQLNSSGRKDTHLLFIVVDGQVSSICLIAPKPDPHSVECVCVGGGGLGQVSAVLKLHSSTPIGSYHWV